MVGVLETEKCFFFTILLAFFDPSFEVIVQEFRDKFCLDCGELVLPF
jgi:hypothetical protein